jgi:hypothetical protein
MQFHDTAELHEMAARNHFEWSGWESERRFGVFVEAMGWRREAVLAEERALEREGRGDGEGAWRERERGRVAGYKAAKAEDERH